MKPRQKNERTNCVHDTHLIQVLYSNLMNESSTVICSWREWTSECVRACACSAIHFTERGGTSSRQTESIGVFASMRELRRQERVWYQSTARVIKVPQPLKRSRGTWYPTVGLRLKPCTFLLLFKMDLYFLTGI